MDRTYLLTLVPLSVISLHFTRGVICTTPCGLRLSPPKKISPHGLTRLHSLLRSTVLHHQPDYLQAFESLHRDHTDHNAGVSWRPRLCALVGLSRVQLSIMCRAQYGISFYVSLSAGIERCGWSLSAQSYLEQSCLTRRDTSKPRNTGKDKCGAFHRVQNVRLLVDHLF